jgi:hypothetical protein
MALLTPSFVLHLHAPSLSVSLASSSTSTIAVCDLISTVSLPACRLLASVGQDDDHTVGVYDWQNKKLKASVAGDKNKSLAVAFSPDGTTVCQVGVSHIKFHTFQGANAKSVRGVLKKKGLLQPFLSVEYLGATAMVGTTDGHIYQFAESELRTAIKVRVCVRVHACVCRRGGACACACASVSVSACACVCVSVRVCVSSRQR